MQLFHFGCLRELRKGCLEGFPSLRFSEVTTESQIDEGRSQPEPDPGASAQSSPHLTAHNWTPGQGPLAICRGGRGFD